MEVQNILTNILQEWKLLQKMILQKSPQIHYLKILIIQLMEFKLVDFILIINLQFIIFFLQMRIE